MWPTMFAVGSSIVGVNYVLLKDVESRLMAAMGKDRADLKAAISDVEGRTDLRCKKDKEDLKAIIAEVGRRLIEAVNKKRVKRG